MTKRRTGRILRITGIVLCCYVIFSFAATAVFSAVFFGRYDMSAPPAVFDRRITFPSGGHTLTGWLLLSEQPHGIVVMCHGYHGAASDGTETASVLRNEGWDVLLFDGTGVGESEGAGTAGLQQGVLDGAAALDWIAAQDEFRDLPVMLFGFSAGGYAAAVLAAERKEVVGAVTLAAFDSPVDLMLSAAHGKAGILVWLEEPFLRLWQTVRFGANADTRPSQTLLNTDVPILAVHVDGDGNVPMELSLCNRLARSDRDHTEIVIVEGTEHDPLSPAFPAARRDALYRQISAFCLACVNGSDTSPDGRLLPLWRLTTLPVSEASMPLSGTKWTCLTKRAGIFRPCSI